MPDVLAQDRVERVGGGTRCRTRPGEPVHDQSPKLPVAVPDVAPQDLVARRARSRDRSDHAGGHGRTLGSADVEERGERGTAASPRRPIAPIAAGADPRVAERAYRRLDGERVARPGSSPVRPCAP